jgi:predicted Zn-dependent protease
VAILLLVSARTPLGQQTPTSPILSAMQDEMRRSMSDLRLKDEPAPYYIDYQVDDLVSMRAVARLGGTVDDLADRGRTLDVQVRVGDYGFDSARFVTQDRGAGLPDLSDIPAPLDDDYDAFRRQIWLTTDAAYKRAVNVFAKKKATFQNRAAAETPLADFSKEQPVETIVPVTAPRQPTNQWVDRIRQLSAEFGMSPGFDASEVWIAETRGNRYYLNSEGFKTVKPIGSALLRVSAETQIADGSTVRDLYTIVVPTLDDLPPVSELSGIVRDVAAHVRTRSTAPIGEDFTGPVLLEGQASAELVRQTLVPYMLARRPADAENPRQNLGQPTPFLTRIGLRVLSDSFTASDTPSLTTFEGKKVAGSYVVDDQGISAKDVTLVDKGRLLTLLTNRTPQKKLPQSNGHGRAGNVNPGVFQLRSTQAVPMSELKAKYLELLKVQEKPFGYIVRSIGGPGDLPGAQGGGPVILDVVKVTPDGAEEPVRGLRFGSVPPAVFRDILDASEERTLHNYRLDVVTSASVIVPSLILEELEIQRTPEIVQKLPAVPSPLR